MNRYTKEYSLPYLVWCQRGITMPKTDLHYDIRYYGEQGSNTCFCYSMEMIKMLTILITNSFNNTDYSFLIVLISNPWFSS